MLQCKDCEFCHQDAVGQIRFECNPFTNIKEPECVAKWQLLKLDILTNRIDTMVRAYEATLSVYRRLAPMQEKMFRHMEREIDDISESDKWKQGYEDEDEDEADDTRPF